MTDTDIEKLDKEIAAVKEEFLKAKMMQKKVIGDNPGSAIIAINPNIGLKEGEQPILGTFAFPLVQTPFTAGKILPVDNLFVKLPSGEIYTYVAKETLWHRVNPKTGRPGKGKGRKELPQFGEYGLTTHGKPKNRNYAPRGSQTTSVPYRKKEYRRTWVKKERQHAAVTEKLELAKKELEKTEELNALISKAPTSKELQQAVLAMFAEKQFNPVAEMVDMVKEDGLESKDKINLLKALADFYPKPKSLDITGAIEHSTVFTVTNFGSGSKARDQEAIEAETVEAKTNTDGPVYGPEAYKEFEEAEAK